MLSEHTLFWSNKNNHQKQRIWEQAIPETPSSNTGAQTLGLLQGDWKISMDTPWIRHGYPMDTLWIRHGYAMGTPWIRHGYVMDMSWIRHGYSMDTPWITPWIHHTNLILKPQNIPASHKNKIAEVRLSDTTTTFVF